MTDTELFAIAGNRLNSIYPPAWIGWLSEREPRFAEGMVRWVFVGDWLAYRLSGVLATDYSITSQTLTLDQRELGLREDLLDAFGLSRDLFLSPRQAGVAIGEVTTQAARATGITAGVPVVLGGADWMIGVFGAGLTEPGDVGILTGTWELTAACLRAACVTPTACESGAICDPHVAPGPLGAPDRGALGRRDRMVPARASGRRWRSEPSGRTSSRTARLWPRDPAGSSSSRTCSVPTARTTMNWRAARSSA